MAEGKKALYKILSLFLLKINSCRTNNDSFATVSSIRQESAFPVPNISRGAAGPVPGSAVSEAVTWHWRAVSGAALWMFFQFLCIFGCLSAYRLRMPSRSKRYGTPGKDGYDGSVRKTVFLEVDPGPRRVRTECICFQKLL